MNTSLAHRARHTHGGAVRKHVRADGGTQEAMHNPCIPLFNDPTDHSIIERLVALIRQTFRQVAELLLFGRRREYSPRGRAATEFAQPIHNAVRADPCSGGDA
jgi:hypothetical protein